MYKGKPETKFACVYYNLQGRVINKAEIGVVPDIAANLSKNRFAGGMYFVKITDLSTGKVQYIRDVRIVNR